jgi:myosin-5
MQLLRRLGATHTHYVRCIKPNATQAPLSMDADIVRSQLRAAGTLEVSE